MAKKRKQWTPAQRRMYRRRRLVALVVLVALLAAAVGAVWGVGKGIGALYYWFNRADINAISRQTVPTAKKTSGVPNCSSSDVRLELTAASSSVAVGGSLDFTAAISYTGAGSCLINGANDSRILTITSGDQTIWKSDICPATSRMLLMSKSQGMNRDEAKITWGINANATDTTCRKSSELPKVKAGTYVARLSLKSDPDLKSDPVVITVQ